MMKIKTGSILRSVTACFFGMVLFSFPLFTAAEQDAPLSEHEQLLKIIEEVRMGWLEADGTPFRNHFLDFPGARYFETGGQNQGLTDLIENHVEPEAGHFASFSLDFSDIETHVENGFAWALANIEIRAARAGQDAGLIHNRGHQTFLFRKVDDRWRVIHTHNSSRPVKKNE